MNSRLKKLQDAQNTAASGFSQTAKDPFGQSMTGLSNFNSNADSVAQSVHRPGSARKKQ
jgi:hypothetical protein